MQGVPVPGLLVFTVADRPGTSAPTGPWRRCWRAFTFAPVVHRQLRGEVVTFHAEIPDVQLDRAPAAVAALAALDDVESIALVTLPGRDEAPAAQPTHDEPATVGSRRRRGGGLPALGPRPAHDRRWGR